MYTNCDLILSVKEAEAMNYLKWKLEEMFRESYKIDVY